MPEPIGRVTVVGEDGLPLAGAFLWIDLEGGNAEFQAFVTNARGEIERTPGTPASLPAGKHQVIARCYANCADDVPTVQTNQRERKPEAPPKAFLEVDAQGRGKILAHVRVGQRAVICKLVDDAKAAGLLGRLEEAG